MNFYKQVKSFAKSFIPKKNPTQNIYFVMDSTSKGVQLKGIKDFEFSDKLLSPDKYFKEYSDKYNIDLKAPIKKNHYNIKNIKTTDNLKGVSMKNVVANSFWVAKDYTFYYYLYDTHTALQNPINFATTKIKGLNHCFVDINGNELYEINNHISYKYGFTVEEWASVVAKNLMITGLAVDTCYIPNSVYSVQDINYQVLPSYQLNDFYVNHSGSFDERVTGFSWSYRQGHFNSSRTYDLYKDSLKSVNRRPFYVVSLDSIDVLPDSRLKPFKNSLGLLYNQILRQSHIYHNGGSSSSLTLISDMLTSGSQTSSGRDIRFEQIQEMIRSAKNIEQSGQKLVIPVSSDNLIKNIRPGESQTFNISDLITNIDIGGKSLLERPVDVNFMKELKKDAWTVFSFSPDTYGEGKGGLNSGHQVEIANKTNAEHVLALLKDPITRLGNNYRFKYILEDLDNSGYFKKMFESKKLIFREGMIERPYTSNDITYNIKPSQLSPSIDLMKIGIEANKAGLINNKQTLTKYFGFEEGEVKDKDVEEDLKDNLETTNKEFEDKPNQVSDDIKQKSIPLEILDIVESTKSLPKLNRSEFPLIATKFFNKKNKNSLRLTKPEKKYIYSNIVQKHIEILESQGIPERQKNTISKIGVIMNSRKYKQFKTIIFEALESHYLSVNLRPAIKALKTKRKGYLDNEKALDKELKEKIKEKITLPTLNTFLDPEILFRILDIYTQVGKLDLENQMQEDGEVMTDVIGERVNLVLRQWITARVENHYLGSPEGVVIPDKKNQNIQDLYYSKDSLDVKTEEQILNEITKVFQEEDDDQTISTIENKIRDGLVMKAENRVEGILHGTILSAFAFGIIAGANNTGAYSKTWLRTITPFPRERGGIKFKEQDHLSTVGKRIPYNAYFIHKAGPATFYSQELHNCRCGIMIGWKKRPFNTVEGIDYYL